MNIITTQYSPESKSLDVYFAGCFGAPHCKNCHNPQSWNFNQGEDAFKVLPKVIQKINDFPNLVENVFILGGEPLDQPEDTLVKFIYQLKAHTWKTGCKLWLFTRKELEEVSSWIRAVDYVKCGRYEPDFAIEDNIQHGIKLASSNQKIYKKGVDYN